MERKQLRVLPGPLLLAKWNELFKKKLSAKLSLEFQPAKQLRNFSFLCIHELLQPAKSIQHSLSALSVVGREVPPTRQTDSQAYHGAVQIAARGSTVSSTRQHIAHRVQKLAIADRPTFSAAAVIETMHRPSSLSLSLSLYRSAAAAAAAAGQLIRRGVLPHRLLFTVARFHKQQHYCIFWKLIVSARIVNIAILKVLQYYSQYFLNVVLIAVLQYFYSSYIAIQMAIIFFGNRPILNFYFPCSQIVIQFASTMQGYQKRYCLTYC